MLNLLLAIFSSALVSVSMRLSESKVKNSLAMLCVNYFMCLVLSWADSGFVSPFPARQGLSLAAGLGLINGLLYLAGFVLLQVSIRKNGVVLSATFMKLGLLVSIGVSILLFRELPGVWQWLGILLALTAILVMNYQRTGQKAGSLVLLLLLMLANGFADGMSKIFDELANPALSAHFLLYTFLAALLGCVALAVKDGSRPGKWEIFFGLLIGIPNFCSAKFLLGALGDLSAVLVYPAASVGTILAVTVTGVLLFKERLTKRQWIAMALILCALVLLNL